MKKRLKFLVAMVFATLLSANVFAYDFVVNGIYYNINSDGTTVSVTYENTSYNSYSGNVTIPTTVTYNGTTYSVTSIGSYAFGYCTGLTSITIPNSVTTIGGGAFYHCTGLTSIIIPNSVTTIGEDAFRNCTGLTSITIGNSVTTIGNGAFVSCTGLTSVSIPNSVTSIGGWAFGNCTGLTSVTIPNSVTTIGLEAFRYCTGLTTINYNPVNCSGDGFSYDYHWLDGCDNITTVNIGNSVQTIPPYFMCRKSGLTSVTIPNSVTSIGESAFSHCTSLDIVTIGSGVTEIRDNAFGGCGSLDTIYSMPTIPPTIYSYTFNNVYRGIPLYVPCGTLEDYSSATYWREFTNIQEDCNDSYLDNANKENTIAVYPNPAKENITLRADEDIFIFNNIGQIVKQINNPKGETTISISDLPRGVYYLRTGNKQQKLIKE
ncbi:MAG: leucine-rich repeat protein [Bacteroidales bacterium]|nr:leucine-rich repeat protein [Bacteroidales bacterium]